ncbi:MAG: hypothetical protein GY754_09290 [bacterium]|nr:hypothetical protein [bacterium]
MSQIRINDLTVESSELSASEASMLYGGGLTMEELSDNVSTQVSAFKMAAYIGVMGLLVPGMGTLVSMAAVGALAVLPAISAVGFTKNLIEDIQD